MALTQSHACRARFKDEVRRDTREGAALLKCDSPGKGGGPPGPTGPGKRSPPGPGGPGKRPRPRPSGKPPRPMPGGPALPSPDI